MRHAFHIGRRLPLCVVLMRVVSVSRFVEGGAVRHARQVVVLSGKRDGPGRSGRFGVGALFGVALDWRYRWASVSGLDRSCSSDASGDGALFPSARHKWSSSDSLMRASARRSSASCWSRATCVDAWTVSRSRVRCDTQSVYVSRGQTKDGWRIHDAGGLADDEATAGTHVVEVQSVLHLVQDTTGHCCKG